MKDPRPQCPTSREISRERIITQISHHSHLSGILFVGASYMWFCDLTISVFLGVDFPGLELGAASCWLVLAAQHPHLSL